MQQSPALSGLSRWVMWPSRSEYNATGATGVSMENTTLECSLLLPRKVVLWVRPSTPKPFQVPEKTPCCGRVTTDFFDPKIIDICQNSLMANHPNCHIGNH